MTATDSPLPEALVVIERDGVLHIEIRQVHRDGDKTFVVFARSDGTEAHVEIDESKLRRTEDGRVKADFVYQGGALAAPEQDV